MKLNAFYGMAQLRVTATREVAIRWSSGFSRLTVRLKAELQRRDHWGALASGGRKFGSNASPTRPQLNHAFLLGQFRERERMLHRT